MVNYTTGDVRDAQDTGGVIIAHVVNDIGVMGAGVALALLTRWGKVKERYLAWYRGEISGAEFGLGNIQPVRVSPDVIVVNMVAQHGIARRGSSAVPLREEALEACLEKLGTYALKKEMSVHLPQIGAGLARGDWTRIEAIIERTLVERGVRVTVYRFEQTRDGRRA